MKQQMDKVVKKGGREERERRKGGREQRVGSLECGKSRVDAHAVCIHPAPHRSLPFFLSLPHCSRGSPSAGAKLRHKALSVSN